MTPLPPGLAAHVAGTAISLCHCWTVRRKDGVAIGFTDHDETLVLDGIAHDPQTGFNASAAEAELGLKTATMDVEGALRSDRINDQDLRAGKYDQAVVETWLVNWQSPGDRIRLRTSRIGRIEISGDSYKAELQGMAEATDRRTGRLIRRQCDAELGDGRCALDISGAAYMTAGTVLAATATMLDVSGCGGFDEGWFEQGALHWTSGANAGTVSKVAGTAADGVSMRLALWLPPAMPVANGDGFNLYAGCDKRFETCKAKFANGLNFRGFPHLPGNDAVYTYVNGDGLFDGGVLTP